MPDQQSSPSSPFIGEGKKARMRNAAFLGLFEHKVPARERGETPILHILGGLPGAGKTSSRSAELLRHAVLTGVDDVKHWAKDVSTIYHRDIAVRVAEASLFAAIANGYDVSYDGILSNGAEAICAIDDMIEQEGMVLVEFLFVCALTSRVRTRFRAESPGPDNGRVVPDEAILKGLQHSLPTFRALYERYRHHHRVAFRYWDADQNGRPRRLLFEARGETLVVHDEARYRDFLLVTPIATEGGRYVAYDASMPR